VSNSHVKDIIIDGLWRNNPALIQLLGLCPLLAVSSTVTNALGLGLATLVVLVGSNVIVSLIRHQLSDAVRLPVFVMIIATFVTCIEMLMKAYTYELFQILGIFVPLIVTNCAILGRAEAFASRHPPALAALDGLMMGMGFLLVLVTLGALRELLGQGSLLVDINLLFGPWAKTWVVYPFGDNYNFLVFVLPPGAFLITGLLIAVKNSIDSTIKRRTDEHRTKPNKGAKRVRTTGKIT
jgi:electron transport complex protein RnfE